MWFVMDLFGDTCELGGGLGLICGVVMISVYYICDMWTCLVIYVIFEIFVWYMWYLSDLCDMWGVWFAQAETKNKNKIEYMKALPSVLAKTLGKSALGSYEQQNIWKIQKSIRKL